MGRSSPSINGAQTVMCSNGAGDRRMLGAECNDSNIRKLFVVRRTEGTIVESARPVIDVHVGLPRGSGRVHYPSESGGPTTSISQARYSFSSAAKSAIFAAS